MKVQLLRSLPWMDYTGQAMQGASHFIAAGSGTSSLVATQDAGYDAAMKPRVVFILSTNYSGSHLLAQLLAAHSLCAGVGELHNYRKFRERGSRSGNVVDDYLDHPAFAGLDRLPVAAWHQTIAERLRPGREDLSHLIDNSKRPSWAKRFPEVSSYYVHLIRDPRALVARWMRTYGADAHRRQRRRVLRRRPWVLTEAADPTAVYLHKWLLSNHAITRFLQRRERASVVTYRDLALKTEATLSRLMPAFDLRFEPGQIDYGSAVAALGTRKREYQDAAAQSAIEIDRRWQEELDDAQRRRIEEHRGVRRYLSALGLTMTEDGLSAGFGQSAENIRSPD